MSGIEEPSCIEDVIAGNDIVVRCAFQETSSRNGTKKGMNVNPVGGWGRRTVMEERGQEEVGTR